MLGETIRQQAILASILGFAGTLVIITGKIGQADFDRDTALVAILSSAMLYAYSFIPIPGNRRSPARRNRHVPFGGIGADLGLAIPFLFEMPETAVLRDLGAAAVLTVIGAMGLAWAYARAEAQVLVPLEYSGFLWASLFGWLFFAEELTLPTAAGTAIIIAACWLATRGRRPPPIEQV